MISASRGMEFVVVSSLLFGENNKNKQEPFVNPLTAKNTPSGMGWMGAAEEQQVITFFLRRKD